MFFENLPYILYVYPYFRREPVLGDWLLTTVSPTTLEGVIAKNKREPSLLPPGTCYLAVHRIPKSYNPID